MSIVDIYFLIACLLCIDVSLPFIVKRVSLNYIRNSNALRSSQILEECENCILHCLQNNNVPKTSTLLLGVSGGVDSVAMVHLFRNLKLKSEWRSVTLKIVHFNHKARWESEEEVQ